MALIKINGIHGTQSFATAEDIQTVTNLDNLHDVEIDGTLGNGQYLVYNSGVSQWKNVDTPPILDELSELTDVTISGVVDGEVLGYNSGTSKWENVTAGAGNVTLNGIETLTNKTLTQPIINEIKFAGNSGSANNFTPLKFTNTYDSSLTPDYSSFNGSFHIANFTSAASDAINVIQLQTPNKRNILRLDAYNQDAVGGNGNTTSKNFTAGSFVTGSTYKIVSVGTTVFTDIGSPNNTVNQVFVATGAGSGDGTADIWDTGAQNVLFGLKGADDIGFQPADSGNLITGVKYKIWYVGDTDFTLIGSPNNTVGTVFTKNAVASSGTGVAVDMRPTQGVWNTFSSNTGAQAAPGWQTNLEFRANKIKFHDAYVFPYYDGTANQVLTTDGAGQLAWADGNDALVDGGTY